MGKQFGVSADQTYQQDFSTALLKEQRPAPFVEHLVHSLLPAKGEQK